MLRRHGQAVADSYRASGSLVEQQAGAAAAPRGSSTPPQQPAEPPVAGTALAIKEELRQDAPASDTPTGVLDLPLCHQLRRSSSEEHELEEAPGSEHALALPGGHASLLRSRQHHQGAGAVF
ncbi:hypothetical protein CHLNCDRAFT_139440 [Chlorella variabilis]|uniref:Uncharacterized protein n=1 Tax=Chlorella variabilis TaxID=554065 RepID=E1ZUH6_CHLVA|nr:hypothetical protein CHLNCDRAFT_139440 [Chlorella variabilis]EFN50519.1 hypothetical protein CHLNCDRAFT_139440 [Chlorella variabilis]|eukprot:XP_005842651.1 hypothetical protein CHLNCDRAFT_139440 [Chlorella variabilis]